MLYEFIEYKCIWIVHRQNFIDKFTEFIQVSSKQLKELCHALITVKESRITFYAHQNIVTAG